MKQTITAYSIARSIFIPVWCMAVACIVAACAITTGQTEQTPAMTPEESLRTASVQYWKMRMEAKYEDTYKIEDKTVLPPFEEYREKVTAMRKLIILKHEVKEVKVDNNAGTVKVEFYVTIPPAPKPFIQILHDYWTYKDGAWLHRLPPE